MTNNIAKIRAALEAAKTTARICVLPGLAQETEVALAALAELERAAQTPAPVAEIREPTEVTRPMCHGAWARFWSEPNTGDSCDQARRWLEAWRAELGPSLGLVEIREPTDDECRNIWREAKVNEGDGSKVCAGRAMFDAVKGVLWPKEGL